MATRTPIHLYEGTPGTSIGLLFSAGAAAGGPTDVDSILAANTTATAATITIERVPAGQAAGTGFAIATAVSIAANATTNVITGGHVVLNPGDALYALQGTASALHLEIDGIVMQP